MPLGIGEYQTNADEVMSFTEDRRLEWNNFAPVRFRWPERTRLLGRKGPNRDATQFWLVLDHHSPTVPLLLRMQALYMAVAFGL